MFQVFMIIGWVAILVLLLYIWADVREIAGVVKDSKRELIRCNFGGRTSGKRQSIIDDDSGWSKQDTEKAAGADPTVQGQAKRSHREEEKTIQAAGEVKKQSEEQILQEVLAEFLG